MRRFRTRAAAAALTAALTLAGLTMGSTHAAADTPLRVMPLGDSITRGQLPSAGVQPTDVGYRAPLKDRLAAAGVTIDYVGPLTSGPATFTDAEHAGYSGWTIRELQTHAVDWTLAYQPDVVLLMAGTNDVIERDDPAGMATRLGQLIDSIRAARPGVLVVASTIPQIGTSKWCCDAGQVAAWNAYRDALPGVAAQHGAAYADQQRVYKSMLGADAIHPKPCGYGWIADNWYFALAVALPPPPGRPWSPLWPQASC